MLCGILSVPQAKEASKVLQKSMTEFYEVLGYDWMKS